MGDIPDSGVLRGNSVEDERLIILTVRSLTSDPDPPLVDTASEVMNCFECLLSLLADNIFRSEDWVRQSSAKLLAI